MSLHEMFFGKPKPAPRFIPEITVDGATFKSPYGGICFRRWRAAFRSPKGRVLGFHAFTLN